MQKIPEPTYCGQLMQVWDGAAHHVDPVIDRENTVGSDKQTSHFAKKGGPP